MPFYEYACTACGHRTDILHGVHDLGPQACPACEAVGTMRKAIAAPAVVFKGSGWAKKERRSTPASAKTGTADGDSGDARDSSGSGTADGASEPATPKAAAGTTSESTAAGGAAAD